MNTRTRLVVLLLLLARPAASEEPRPLSLADARAVIAAGQAEARRIGAPCVIAVVDAGGWLVALERMDDSPMLASVELAPGKARAAALFRKPTAALETAIEGGRAAALSASAMAMPGLVQMAGGLPLLAGPALRGAVGVSSPTPADDERIAAAAAAAGLPAASAVP